MHESKERTERSRRSRRSLGLVFPTRQLRHEVLKALDFIVVDGAYRRTWKLAQNHLQFIVVAVGTVLVG